MVVGKIVGSRVETRPWEAGGAVPCSSEKPDEICQLPRFDVVRFVVDLRPVSPPTVLPEGKRQGVQVPADLMSIEVAIGFVNADDRDAANAAAASMATTLTATLPVGATMESVVLVLEDGPDLRPTHFGMLATAWALVEPGGRLVQARRPEWIADDGLLGFSTMNESMSVLLSAAEG